MKLGGSLTAVTVMINVCGALVSTPPLAVPPLSLAVTVTVAAPLALGADRYVNVPADDTLGCTAKRPLLLLVTMKVTICPAATSSGGPARILVAQPVTVCVPASSRAVWSGPLVKLGGSLTGVTLMVNV